MKRLFVYLCLAVAGVHWATAQVKSLHELQQEFVDLRFGMFIHFNMPTFFNEDWPDPDADPALFNPAKMDCGQWARAAKSAHMTYGCLTTKHHSGFCIWDTKTTDYNVMQSPFRRDVVKEYAEAFRAEGLKVMLYYSILDTHARLRPHCIRPDHITLIKEQLRELLTNYGEITALIIDGWDAPWRHWPKSAVCGRTTATLPTCPSPKSPSSPPTSPRTAPRRVLGATTMPSLISETMTTSTPVGTRTPA